VPRFHPSRFPEELAADSQGAAERQVFDALVDHLPDDYLVLHRVRWLGGPTHGWGADGSLDLLIAHPERGMLAMVVRGGVRRDASSGRWLAGEAEIRDPFELATASKHALERYLKHHPKWLGRGVPIGHAVAVPGASKNDLDVPFGGDPITLDESDLASPLAAVERALEFWSLAIHDDWRKHGLTWLERLFVHRDFARLRLGARIGQHEREFIRLTARQSRVLDQLRHHRRAAICGCAGSGKTMLAIEKARRLADEGYRVLLTCYNKPLAESIRAQLPRPLPTRAGAAGPQTGLFGDPEVEVEHFHAMAARWSRRAGVSLVEPVGKDQQRQFFAATLPGALLTAAERTAERYDAIIVDEGQDFHESWWTPLQALLSDKDHGVLYVFYDDNQSLYTDRARLPIETPPFVLTTNCRNTRAIHEEVVRWYRGAEVPDAQGPDGEPPERISYADEHGLREQLRRVLERLVREEKVPERDIVVLSPRGRDTSALWRDPQLGSLRLTDAWPPAAGHVQCATVHSFKGLERPVVLLAELSASAATADEIRYVGSSRARSHLVLIEERRAG